MFLLNHFLLSEYPELQHPEALALPLLPLSPARSQLWFPKVSGKGRLILKEGLRIPANSSRHEGAEGGGARSRRALRNQVPSLAGRRGASVSRLPPRGRHGLFFLSPNPPLCGPHHLTERGVNKRARRPGRPGPELISACLLC